MKAKMAALGVICILLTSCMPFQDNSIPISQDEVHIVEQQGEDVKNIVGWIDGEYAKSFVELDYENIEGLDMTKDMVLATSQDERYLFGVTRDKETSLFRIDSNTGQRTTIEKSIPFINNVRWSIDKHLIEFSMVSQDLNRVYIYDMLKNSLVTSLGNTQGQLLFRNMIDKDVYFDTRPVKDKNTGQQRPSIIIVNNEADTLKDLGEGIFVDSYQKSVLKKGEYNKGLYLIKDVNKPDVVITITNDYILDAKFVYGGKVAYTTQSDEAFKWLKKIYSLNIYDYFNNDLSKLDITGHNFAIDVTGKLGYVDSIGQEIINFEEGIISSTKVSDEYLLSKSKMQVAGIHLGDGMESVGRAMGLEYKRYSFLEGKWMEDVEVWEYSNGLHLVVSVKSNKVLLIKSTNQEIDTNIEIKPGDEVLEALARCKERYQEIKVRDQNTSIVNVYYEVEKDIILIVSYNKSSVRDKQDVQTISEIVLCYKGLIEGL